MRLLLVEDNVDDAELTLAELRRFGFDPEHRRVASLRSLAEALDEGAWSAVISDYDLGGFTANDALALVRGRDRELPFIIVSGNLGEELAVDVIRAGANDYVMKDRLGRLGPALERELRDVQLRQERRALFNALRRSEDRYRRIFEQAPIGVAVSTPSGIITAVNGCGADILARRRDEIAGRLLAEFTNSELPAAPGERRELSFIRPDGASVWADVTLAPIESDSPDVGQLIWLIEDITARRAAAEELRNSRAELERRNVQQVMIANLGQAALSGEPLDAILAQAADAVTRILGADFCEILQHTGEKFRLVGGAGFGEDFVIGSELEAPIATQAAYTLRTNAPVIAEHAAAETRFPPSQFLLRHGIVSSATVPVGAGRAAPWGVLGAQSRTARQFSAGDVDFLRAIANVLGQAAERDRVDQQLFLHAAQQSAIAELSRVALRNVDDAIEISCTVLMDVLGVDHAVFFELDEYERMLRYRAGRCWRPAADIDLSMDGDSPVASALRRNVPGLIAGDRRADEGIVAGLAVPVATGSERFGVLTAHAKRDRTFVESDLEFIQSVANILADAMDRDRARRALTASEERYREVVEGASEIIFTLSREGHFTSLNAAFTNVTGWSVQEWLGRAFTGLIHPADAPLTRALFERIVRTREAANAEVRIVGRNGVVVLDVASFPKVGEDGVAAVYGFARDVTEAQRTERERLQLTRNLQLLLESTVDGILTLDLQGRCTLSNRAAATMLGREQEAMLGVHADLLLGDSEIAREIVSVARGAAVRSVERATFCRSDRNSFPVEYSAAPIIDEGVSVGVVLSFSDITERRKLEAKLEQADRLTSLGRLAATIAHEFNNVLMGISPFVEVVRRGRNVDSSLDHIGRAVQRGKRITQDILRFTQPAQPVRTAFDLRPWLEGIVLEARSLMPKGYEIAADAQPGIRIHGDANQLQQIFTNLILNARDAMPYGGTLAIEVGREQPDARFSFGLLDHPERFAHFVVRDSGHGIDAETLRHIFEPLFTTKKNGTGLGLPVAHQVVQRHGGDIFVESTPGEGTTFHIFLPLAEDSERLAGEVAAASDPVRARRVLLVEDDTAVATGLAALLELDGLEVEVAESGAAAIRALRQSAPDVVVLDVGLPDMDGTAVYRDIAAIHPELPVIFSTGHADQGKLDPLLEQPHVAFLLKPYDSESLLDAIREVMR